MNDANVKNKKNVEKDVKPPKLFAKYFPTKGKVQKKQKKTNKC